MRLRHVRVQNFRCIREASVPLDSATAFVGGNGTGKSTILRALDVFYAGSPNITREDYYNRDTEASIEIELTFHDFTPQERDLFASKIEGDSMTVVRVFSGSSAGKYFGTSLSHPEFADIRAKNGMARRTTFNDFARAHGDYGLVPVTAVAQVQPALEVWEQLHPDQCVRQRDDGQFFGFTNNAVGKLQRATSFVFVPAVRDAAVEAGSGRNTGVTRLLDLVVRSAIERRAEVRAFRERMSQQYRELMDPANLPELGGLATALSETLRQYYANAAVDLQWQPIEDIDAPPPLASVALEEDRFRASVDRTGHGLQRAFVLALLQHLAIRSVAVEETEQQQDDQNVRMVPGLILAIEEPELYQHPSKQRHFAKVLGQLADGAIQGVAQQTQVLFATHSPHFIAMKDFAKVRLARRVPQDGGLPPASSFSQSGLADVSEVLRNANGAGPEYSAAALVPRLHIMNAEICEGFFATVAVMVEGVSDRAALLAAAALQGVDLESMGVAIIPCGSANNLDRPFAIFTALAIPTYLVWDGDHGENEPSIIRRNRALQKLLGVGQDAILDNPAYVDSRSACFYVELEETLRAELGDIYGPLLDEQRDAFEFNGRADVVKVPECMIRVLTAAADQGRRSDTLKMIVDAIVAMATAALQREAYAVEVPPAQVQAGNAGAA